MDISLNIIKKPVKRLNKDKEKGKTSDKPNVKVKKTNGPAASGFSFNFTKNSKIKAFVAKRRVNKTLNNKIKNDKSNSKSKTVVKKQESLPLSFEISENERDLNLSESKDDDDDDNITIGIFNKPPPPKIKKKNNDSATGIISNKKGNQRKQSNKNTVSKSTDIVEKKSNKKMSKNSNESLEEATSSNDEEDNNISIGIFNKPPPERVKKQQKVDSSKTTSFSNNNSFPNKKSHSIEKQSVANDSHEKQFQKKPFTEKKKKRKTLAESSAELPEVQYRNVEQLKENVFSGLPIESIGFHAHLVKNLADVLKITELTSVQQRAVPVILENKDVLVRSQTGSGKTLAFALPIVQILQNIRPKVSRSSGIQALVVAPTRELVIQTYDLFIKLLKPFTWIIPGYLCGGEKRKSEKARLRKGINIMIGTPGRLCDHLTHTESFRLDSVKWLILDEADKLLELGYEKDVRIIVEALNKNSTSADVSEKTRQTMLLSATLTPAVEKLAGLALNNPLFIDNTDTVSNLNGTASSHEDFSKSVRDAISGEKLVVPSTIVQIYVILPPKLRLVALSGLIAMENKKKPAKILVFLATQDLVDFHHDIMVEVLTKKILDEDDEDQNEDTETENNDCLLKGVRFFKLHGSMTQQERKSVFKAFWAANSGVLLSTDVAARGIDVPEVDCVIQFTPPQKLSDYVHRIGRTARAGRSGRAILFLNPTEIDFVHMLNDKGLKLHQDDFQKYLKPLVIDRKRPNAADEYVSDLQHKYEELIIEDSEINEKACKAFVSWVRFYSAFPRDMRHIFNRKNVHMGHYAKSLGLREPPTSFARQFTQPRPVHPTNRLTYAHKENPENNFQNTPDSYQDYGTETSRRLGKFASKSISLTTSEFDSGLQPTSTKKRKFNDN